MYALTYHFDIMQRARKGYSRALEPICRRWELTRNELDILLFLANNPGLDRASDIVIHRGISKSHVSQSVSNLQSRGLLLCRTDDADRRSVRLGPAERAEEIIRAGREAQQGFFSALSAGLTEQELALWQTLNGKICRNIENMAD